MRFIPIPKNEIDNMWSYIEPILLRSVSLTPDRIDTKDVYDETKKGSYLLWVVYEEIKNKNKIHAVLTTRISQYPKTKALCIDFVAGHKMKDWLPIVMPVFEDLGKSNGCTHIEGYGRKAWQKYLQEYGWKTQHIQYEKRLDNE